MAQLAAANWRDTTCAGVLAFLISMWITNFFSECDAMVFGFMTAGGRPIP